MSDAEDRVHDVAENHDGAPGAGRSDRMRVRFRDRAGEGEERERKATSPAEASPG